MAGGVYSTAEEEATLTQFNLTQFNVPSKLLAIKNSISLVVYSCSDKKFYIVHSPGTFNLIVDTGQLCININYITHYSTLSHIGNSAYANPAL